MTITIAPPDNRTSGPIDPVDPTPAAAKARRVELIDIHVRAGHLVAELSVAPARVDAARVISRFVVEAEQVINGTAAPDLEMLPAVVRCRELAAAQRRMVVALEDDHRLDVGETPLARGRALLAELVELAAEQRATLRR